MELENQETVVEEVKVNEPSQEVSSESTAEDTKQEWVAPQTPDELDVMLKSASNKAKTAILKELGVKSIKEFKESYEQTQSKLSEFENIQKEKDKYASKYESLVNEHTSLKHERVLDKLNIQDEYREDLTKLALDKVNDSMDFEAVISDMVNDKYRYTVNGNQQLKMSTEKTQKEEDTNGLSSKTIKKYPWIK